MGTQDMLLEKHGREQHRVQRAERAPAASTSPWDPGQPSGSPPGGAPRRSVPLSCTCAIGKPSSPAKRRLGLLADDVHVSKRRHRRLA